VKSATRRIEDLPLPASGPLFPPTPSPNLLFCTSGSYFRPIYSFNPLNLLFTETFKISECYLAA